MIRLRNTLRIFIANAKYFLGGGKVNSKHMPRPIRLALAICRMPYAFVRCSSLLLKPLVFRQITLVIGTKCTLKCAKCANLMPYYGNGYKLAYMISAKSCISDFNSLLEHVDYIYELNVIGGEPFLHKGLTEILEYLIQQPKIRKVCITTNGTICPDDTVAFVLKNPKIFVSVSNYGQPSKNTGKLVAWLDKNGVQYSNSRISRWAEIGDMIPRGRNFDTLKKMFFTCRIPHCVTFLNGRLYHCTRSAHGMDLGIIPDLPQEYIDVTVGGGIKIREKIKDFRLNTITIAACDYCDNARIIPIENIPPGVQAI